MSKQLYELTWYGKQDAVKEAGIQTNSKLVIDETKSKNFDSTDNIYIEGDNLDALKLLQEEYKNRIKCIYIDPPYNKNKKFIYNDKFAMSEKEYLKLTNQVDCEHKETDGRFHINWLNMMYPRLILARELLSDDGVIFISIDDDELANLMKICNEIFKKENFIANIIRNTNSSKNQSLFVSVSHEYCLVYAKNKKALESAHKDNKWSVPKNNVTEYKKKINEMIKIGLSNDEITEELKELTKYPRFTDFMNYWYLDDRGVYQKDNLGGVKNGNMTPLFNPLTNNYDPIPPGGFRYDSEKLKKLVEDNRIHFHTDGSLPRVKRYLDENLTSRPKSIMSDDQRPDNSLLKAFNTPFDNPKQLDFMTRILSIFEKDATILDFFSGSATTAHAILKLNAEDGGDRKFIMVQLQEELDENSEAYKLGYRTICDIGQERIRRAGDKIVNDNENKIGVENLDIGFKVFKVVE